MTLRRRTCLVFLLVASAAVGSLADDTSSPRRLLMVSIDGLMPAEVLEADRRGLAIPNLRRLMAEGAYAHAVTGVLPTNTYPSHTTLSTGVPPRLHGILGNAIFDPERIANDAWDWYAADVRVPTLVDAARAAGRSTAEISWPVTVGAHADSLVPEFWRSGSSHPDDLKLMAALSTPGLLAEVERALGRPLAWPMTDDDRTAIALHVLATRKPEVLLLHLIEHDHFCHTDGCDSARARAALEASDADLGRLRAALEQLGLAGSTLVAVVSDHGYLPTRVSLQPNVLLGRAGLITLDARAKVASWRAQFWAQGGTALLRLADPRDGGTLEKVRALVIARAHERDSGIAAVLGAEEIRAQGGDPEVTPLVLDAGSGFCFGGAVAGPWRTPAHNVAGHGYAPTHPELAASLFVSGPGLARHGDLGTLPMTRIAPTLAAWLGVTLDPRAGPAGDWLAPAR